MKSKPGTRTFVLTAIGLLLLLAVTAIVGLYDLGPWNIVVALAISVAKAALIMLIFMELKFGDRIMWMVAGGGILWLGILFTLSLSDYLTRGYSGIPGK